jgi:hypothetical protein
MTAILLTVLLSFPPHVSDRDEPPDARRERLAELAGAVEYGAAGDKQIAAALVAQALHETRLAAYTFEAGRCIEGKRWGAACDWDRKRNAPRARGYFQVHRVACRAAWAAPEGSRASNWAAARCVAGALRLGYRRCGKSWVGAFSALSGAWTCSRPTAPARVATMRQVLATLSRSANSS